MDAKAKFYSHSKTSCAYKECYKNNGRVSILGRVFHLQLLKRIIKTESQRLVGEKQKQKTWKQTQRGKEGARDEDVARQSQTRWKQPVLANISSAFVV